MPTTIKGDNKHKLTLSEWVTLVFSVILIGFICLLAWLIWSTRDAHADECSSDYYCEDRQYGGETESPGPASPSGNNGGEGDSDGEGEGNSGESCSPR